MKYLLFLFIATAMFAATGDLLIKQKQANGAWKDVTIPVANSTALGFNESGAVASVTDLSVTTATATSLVFEGATADTYETTITVVDPTADNTITLPNASGTVAFTATKTGTLGTPSTGTLSPTWTAETHIVYVGGTQTINLPVAAGYSGRALMLVFMGSYVATVDPNASEIIYRAGTAQTGGVSCTVTGTLGQQAIFVSDGTSWITVGTSATLTVGS